MEKAKLLEAIRSELERQLETLEASARAAHEGATHEESRSEDQYDTRGLEASYLAGAQSARAEEIKGLLRVYKFFKAKEFKKADPIEVAALVTLQSEDETKSMVFVGPGGKPLTVSVGKQTVQVITTSSPLGGALLGKQVGDFVEIEAKGTTREYEILSVR